jgi:phosphotransferase system HPr (HPr) family protein
MQYRRIWRAVTFMTSKKLTINNPTGIHARPATELVKLANRFSCNLQLINHSNGKVADPKSIFSLLSTAIKAGSSVELKAEGLDEAKAVEQIAEFIDSLEE